VAAAVKHREKHTMADPMRIRAMENGGTTDVAVYTEGHIRHSEVILIGGDYITKDISRAFVTPFDTGESLKQRYGLANCEMADPDEQIEIVRISGRKPISVKRQELAWVIEARVEQILDQVRRSLVENNLHDKIFGGIVLTGGTALLSGLREKAEEYLGMETQIGYPTHITGCKDIITSPMYATAVGLLHYGRWKKTNPVLGSQSWMGRTLNRAIECLGAMI